MHKECCQLNVIIASHPQMDAEFVIVISPNVVHSKVTKTLSS